MDKLFEHFHKLLRDQNTDFHRYIYSKINWNSRMIGLTGPRGVGKTTLVLQHIKQDLNPNESLYVTAEDFYFADKKLIDLADLLTKKGIKYLFIDEIHKYKDWSKELKLIYDYHPELKIVFTGSSVLDINKGASDLSRRAVMYQMQGLSFREYLKLFHGISADVYTLQDIIAHKVKVPGIDHPLPLFEEYLKRGYYPFAMEDEYDLRLQQIINQTLESDIPQYADMNVSTGRKLKQLLAIISKSVPFKPNISSIATMLGASRNNIADYCLYIEEAGLIAQLRDNTGGIRGLGKVDKIYLDNTNLIYNLAQDTPNIGNIRETFFFNQTKVNYDVIASPISDFLIDNITFEIGGKNKGQKQIQGIENSFVVKDDIEFGYTNIVPLWQFGMSY
ncbi:AAA family ATPase [uncultured Bacteroides sp.]|uniref:ATP-binding protein n=1 Tax=uncultured Bacteroides sp. TaxID=162156 RepID=UPI002AA8CB26|nr:AAA family ATPase [uncultured Bacteroides sp.]